MSDDISIKFKFKDQTPLSRVRQLVQIFKGWSGVTSVDQVMDGVRVVVRQYTLLISECDDQEATKILFRIEDFAEVEWVEH